MGYRTIEGPEPVVHTAAGGKGYGSGLGMVEVGE